MHPQTTSSAGPSPRTGTNFAKFLNVLRPFSKIAPAICKACISLFWYITELCGPSSSWVLIPGSFPCVPWIGSMFVLFWCIAELCVPFRGSDNTEILESECPGLWRCCIEPVSWLVLFFLWYFRESRLKKCFMLLVLLVLPQPNQNNTLEIKRE